MNRLINAFILNKYVFVDVLCGVICLVGLESSADAFCEPHNRVRISLVKNVFLKTNFGLMVKKSRKS